MRAPKQAPVYRERRTTFLLCVLGVLYLILTFRVMWIQWWDRTFYIRQADARQVRTIQAQWQRQPMFDRQNLLLAGTVTKPTVYLNIPDALHFDASETDALAAALAMAPAELRHRIDSARSDFLMLGRQLPEDRFRAAKAAAPYAVSGFYESVRLYPGGPGAVSVVGAVNSRGGGLSGAEFLFDRTIRQASGDLVLRTDRLGNVVEIVRGSLSSIEEDKQAFHLGVDLRLQWLVHQTLGQAEQAHSGMEFCLIVTDAGSGEVLALDAVGKRLAAPPRGGSHPASELAFEPRLLAAPFVILAGLEHGALTETEEFPSAHPVLGALSNAPPGVHRQIKVADMLSHHASLAIAAAGMQLRPELLRAALHSSGLNQASGLGFDNEPIGLLEQSQWRPADQARVALGRSFKVNLAQLARAYGMLHNKGAAPLVTLKGGPSMNAQAPTRFSPKHVESVRRMLPRWPNQSGEERRILEDAYVMGVEQSGRFYRRHVNLLVATQNIGTRTLVAVLYLDSEGGDLSGNSAIAKSLVSRVFDGANAEGEAPIHSNLENIQ